MSDTLDNEQQQTTSEQSQGTKLKVSIPVTSNGVFDNNKSILYQSEDGALKLPIRTDKQSVWLSMSDIARLFNVTKAVVSQNIQAIYDENELDKNDSRQKLTRTASDGNNYEINHYNIDVIYALGYRLRSKEAIEFRNWASRILKKYAASGYVLNVKTITQSTKQLSEVTKILEFITKNSQSKSINEVERLSFLELLKEYAEGVLNTDKKHSTSIDFGARNLVKSNLSFENYLKAVILLKEDLIKNGEATNLFGQQYEDRFNKVIHSINERFNGREIYETIEQKASLLIYLTVKSKPFVDGNKRIASFLFLYLLNQNDYLFDTDGQQKISDDSLMALTILVDKSTKDDKSMILNLIKTLILSAI